MAASLPLVVAVTGGAADDSRKERFVRLQILIGDGWGETKRMEYMGRVFAGRGMITFNKKNAL